MAAQNATSLRRLLAEAEAHAAVLRDQKSQIEAQLLEVPAVSWPDVAAKARYVLNLYSATLQCTRFTPPRFDRVGSEARQRELNTFPTSIVFPQTICS